MLSVPKPRASEYFHLNHGVAGGNICKANLKESPKGQKVKEEYEFEAFRLQNGQISEKLVYFALICHFK